jgi:hypothetical protein
MVVNRAGIVNPKVWSFVFHRSPKRLAELENVLK